MTDKEKKNMVIDNTIKLLKYFKDAPTYKINYLIKAKNEDIIEYLKESTIEDTIRINTDWDGKLIIPEGDLIKESEKLLQQRLENFDKKKSDTGYSVVEYSINCTLDSIRYETVWNYMFNHKIKNAEFVDFIWDLNHPFNIEEIEKSLLW